MKTKLLIIATLLVSIAMFSTGAFAYFSSQTTNTGNISSGTLTLNVATGDCSQYGSTATVWSMAQMAPGDTFEGKLCMKNTGTVGANQVTYEWVYDAALRPLADRIFVVGAYDSTDSDPAAVLAQFISMGDGIVPGMPADGKLSFTELSWLSNHYSYPFDAVSGGAPWLAANGGSQWLFLKFKFDETAGNEFQGKGFSYTLNVTAEQRNVFP
jgi:hypothetical protein